MVSRSKWLATLVFVLAAAAGCRPQIASIAPPEACPGDRVVIEGTDFGPLPFKAAVTFGGVAAPAPLGWANDRIEVRVPQGAASGPVVVKVHNNVSDEAPFGVLAGLECRRSLIPGPAEPGYDGPLEALARQYDRQFHAIHALPMAVNADVTVGLDKPADRETIRAFLQETDDWDLAAYAGKPVEDVVSTWQKVAGLYAGVGIAADAYRYGVLRDQGYEADEVERARGHLVAALDALHRAMAITGTEGVIARGYIRTDIPGPGATEPLTPLFDGEGNPLPPEKNNGTWRADNSGGEFPNYIWEDSCSRDMFIGWATAFGAAWEVIAGDPAFDDALKARLRTDAAALGRMMTTVQASGYDLEIQDADGRPTFHAYLNENAFDRLYLPFLPFKAGQHATMSLGIMSALAYASGAPDLESYVDEALLGTRSFQGIIASNQLGVDFGVETNYSNVNMIAAGFWLTARFVPAARPDAREKVRLGLAYQFYDRPGGTRQPKETMQSLYDLVYIAGLADGSAWGPAANDYDAAALAQAYETLHAFPEPPFWDIRRENCDQDEIDAGFCIAVDGTPLTLLGFVGRGDQLVAAEPIPMRIRPPSNYFWRSNPYEPNGGGDGSRLLPGVDFRFVYWAGRWAR